MILTYRIEHDKDGYYFCDDASPYNRSPHFPDRETATAKACEAGQHAEKHGMLGGESVLFAGVLGAGVCTVTAVKMGAKVLG